MHHFKKLKIAKRVGAVILAAVVAFTSTDLSVLAAENSPSLSGDDVEVSAAAEHIAADTENADDEKADEGNITDDSKPESEEKESAGDKSEDLSEGNSADETDNGGKADEDPFVSENDGKESKDRDGGESEANDDGDEEDAGLSEDETSVDGEAVDGEDPEITDELPEEIEAGADISANDLPLAAVTSLAVPASFKGQFKKDRELSWNLVSGANGYEIYFAVDPQNKLSSLFDSEYRIAMSIRRDGSSASGYSAYWDEDSDTKCGAEITVSGSRLTCSFDASCLPITETNRGNAYELPLDYQYLAYKVRAVYTDESCRESVHSNFTDPVSSYGMFYSHMDIINSKRKKAFKMPGSTDYVRFYVGDPEGTEYNKDHPVELHVGESIDDLCLWAECKDGSIYNYEDLLQKIIDKENKNWGGGIIVHDDYYNDEYGFTWTISSDIIDWDDGYRVGESYIDTFLQQEEDQTLGRLGFKALKKTEGSIGLKVVMNEYPGTAIRDFSLTKDRASFLLMLPVVILDAEPGVEYEEKDPTIVSDDVETFWQKIREAIHKHEKKIVGFVDNDAYKEFADQHHYYTLYDENGEVTNDESKAEIKNYCELIEDAVADDWLYGTYEENEYMEPWAYDYLSESIWSLSGSAGSSYPGGKSYHYLKLELTYPTTAAQEKWVDDTIASWLKPGGKLYAVKDKSPYERAKAAMDIVHGIQWVNGLVSVGGRPSKLNYTTFSALKYNQGSCEASALTLERLCRELGVPCRVIKDDYWGGSGCHAYNIIKIGDKWYYADGGSGQFLKGSSTFSKSKELAIYRSSRFKASHPISTKDYAPQRVVYTLNGGKNASSNAATFESGEQISLNQPTRTGYTFGGWYKDKSFTNLAALENGDTIDTTGISGNLNLYAKWIANTYTIVYDSNYPEGLSEVWTSGEMTGVSAQYDKTFSVNTCGYLAAGYSFSGWNSKADGSGKTYDPGNKTTGTVKNLSAVNGAEVTLYAQWKPVKYTIKYDANASSVVSKPSGTMKAQTVSYFSDITTTKNAFKATGYVFTGWSTKAAPDEGDFYAETASGITTVSGSRTDITPLDDWAYKHKNTVTLYAQWRPIKYAVYFDKGVIPGTDPEAGEISSGTMVCGRTDGEGLEILPTAYGLELEYGDSVFLRGTEYRIKGYTLSGWKNSATGKVMSNSEIKNLTAREGDIITLTAQWKPKTYKVIYDLDGGKVKKKNPASVLVGNDLKIACDPTKTGEKFISWAPNITKADVTDELLAAAEETPLRAPAVVPNSYIRSRDTDVHILAIFKPISYRIAYNTGYDAAKAPYLSELNLDTAVEAGYTITTEADYYTEISLADAARAMEAQMDPSYSGKKTITGFSTQPNGKGTKYALNKTCRSLTARDGSTVTLYANWSTATHRINYELMTGAKNDKKNPASFSFGTKAITLKAPVRTGYRFGGWYKTYDPDAEEAEQFADPISSISGATCDLTGDVTIYAKWTPVVYTVKLDKNGAVVSDAEAFAALTADLVNIPYDETELVDDEPVAVVYPIFEEDVLAAMSKNGYVFDGFNTKADGKGTKILLQDFPSKEDPETMVKACILRNVSANAGTVTLYAQWKNPTCSISYVNYLSNGTPLGGVKNTSPVSFQKNNTSAVSLKNPTKTGYTFQGWFTGYDEETHTFSGKLTAIPKKSAADVTLYGKWTENKYSLTLETNGAVGSKATVSLNYTESFPLTTALYKSGYVLTGWSTKKNGKATYLPNAAVCGLSAKASAKITLYPIWTKVSVKKQAISSAEQVSSNMILHFRNDGADVDRYEVRRSMTAAMKAPVDLTPAAAPEFEDDGVYPGAYYQVRTVKLDSSGAPVYGAWSDPWTPDSSVYRY